MEDRLERAFYRVLYPRSLRPILLIGAERFSVVDASELGLRFIAIGLGPSLGAAIIGRLALPETPPMEIEGIVVRRDDRYVALALAPGIPYRVILDQQRLLHQRILI